MAFPTSESRDETLRALERMAEEAPNEQYANNVRRFIERLKRGDQVEPEHLTDLELENFALVEIRLEQLFADEITERLLVDDSQLSKRDKAQRTQQFKSLKTHGQLHEVIVYQRSAEVYCVTQGMGRVRDAIKAGRKLLRCKVFPKQESAVFAALVDGYRRPRSGVDLLKEVLLVGHTHKIQQDVIAQSLGVTPGRISQVKQHLENGAFKPEFRNLIEKGCTESVASELLEFEPDQREKIISDWRKGEEDRPWPTKAFLRALGASEVLHQAYFVRGLPFSHVRFLVKSEIVNRPVSDQRVLLDWLASDVDESPGHHGWKPVEAFEQVRIKSGPIEESIPGCTKQLSRTDSQHISKVFKDLASHGQYIKADVVRIVRPSNYRLRIDVEIDDIETLNRIFDSLNG